MAYIVSSIEIPDTVQLISRIKCPDQIEFINWAKYCSSLTNFFFKGIYDYGRLFMFQWMAISSASVNGVSLFFFLLFYKLFWFNWIAFFVFWIFFSFFDEVEEVIFCVVLVAIGIVRLRRMLLLTISPYITDKDMVTFLRSKIWSWISFSGTILAELSLNGPQHCS